MTFSFLLLFLFYLFLCFDFIFIFIFPILSRFDFYTLKLLFIITLNYNTPQWLGHCLARIFVIACHILSCYKYTLVTDGFLLVMLTLITLLTNPFIINNQGLMWAECLFCSVYLSSVLYTYQIVLYPIIPNCYVTNITIPLKSLI